MVGGARYVTREGRATRHCRHSVEIEFNSMMGCGNGVKGKGLAIAVRIK